jgi:putative membrane protein
MRGNIRGQAHGAGVAKGLVAGLAGGLAGSWMMNQFQAQISKLSPTPPQVEQGDDATEKAAAALSDALLQHPLTKEEKALAGPAVHYAFGSAVGAFYGAAAEVAPSMATAWGGPFSIALWIGADEIAVPAFGLAGKPTDSPLTTHAYALASHLVYGFTADAVRRAVRAAL